MNIRDKTLLKARFIDLQRNQAAKRPKVWRAIMHDELTAIKKLGFDCFGRAGFIETNSNEVGMIYIGFYTDGQWANRFISHVRERKLILRGTSYAELEEQAKFLGLLPWQRNKKRTQS